MDSVDPRGEVELHFTMRVHSQQVSLNVVIGMLSAALYVTSCCVTLLLHSLDGSPERVSRLIVCV